MSGMDKFFKGLDSFRRIPLELTEASFRGGLLTSVAWALMVILFLCEFWAFRTTRTITTVTVDKSQAEHILINFNVTLLELPCKYTAVDVWDSFGNDRLNVTANITKVRLDENHTQGDEHDDHQHHIIHAEHPEIIDNEEDDGGDALHLTDKTWKPTMDLYDFVFVNFYAPWCMWSQRLAPTWEDAAEDLEKMSWEDLGVTATMARVNCDAHRSICRQQYVRAFPSMELYHKGKLVRPSYNGHRTKDAILEWLVRKIRRPIHHQLAESAAEFVDRGCIVSGSLQVSRVPGNFHLEARSETESLHPENANLSHVVNHLSFGAKFASDLLYYIPEKDQTQLCPLDGKAYTSPEDHCAPHHYLKVVSTTFEKGGHFGSEVEGYQFTTNNRIAQYSNSSVPEAKFSYDISSLCVAHRSEGKAWYEFITSLFAIIGGTFTVMQLFDGVVENVNVRLKKDIGKFG